MLATIRFSYQDRVGSSVIKALTWSKWSHVELVRGDEAFGARMEGGVKWRPVARLPYHQFLDIHLEVPDNFLEILTSQEGKGYDFVALFGGILRRNWQDPEKWFCSELIAWALTEVGKICVQNINRVSPRELCLILHNLDSKRVAQVSC